MKTIVMLFIILVGLSTVQAELTPTERKRRMETVARMVKDYESTPSVHMFKKFKNGEVGSIQRTLYYEVGIITDNPVKCRVIRPTILEKVEGGYHARYGNSDFFIMGESIARSDRHGEFIPTTLMREAGYKSYITASGITRTIPVYDAGTPITQAEYIAACQSKVEQPKP